MQGGFIFDQSKSRRAFFRVAKKQLPCKNNSGIKIRKEDIMNKKVLLALAVAFILGLSVNYAFSEVPVGFKVAVIDVQKLVLGSSQIKC